MLAKAIGIQKKKTGSNRGFFRYNLATPIIKLTIKISEKTERRFSVILAPLSSKECNRKDNLYRE